MILIDNGHGCDTAGKRSPDGLILEWLRTRQMAKMLQQMLAEAGIESMLLVPEDADTPLAERARRANAVAGARLLVSLHINAAGNGAQWMNARGWSAHIAPSCGAESRRAASVLAKSMEAEGVRVRRPAPEVNYWEQPLAICRLTKCPAVLTENLFMDNREDCSLLLDDEYLAKLAGVHASAIIKILNDND